MKIDTVMAIVVLALIVVVVVAPISVLVWKDALAYQPKTSCQK